MDGTHPEPGEKRPAASAAKQRGRMFVPVLQPVVLLCVFLPIPIGRRVLGGCFGKMALCLRPHASCQPRTLNIRVRVCRPTHASRSVFTAVETTTVSFITVGLFCMASNVEMKKKQLKVEISYGTDGILSTYFCGCNVQ